MSIFKRRRSPLRVIRGGLSGLGIYTDQQKAAIQSVIATNSAMSALPANTLLSIASSNGYLPYNPTANDPALNAALQAANLSLRNSGAPYYFGGEYGYKRDLRSLYSQQMGAMGIEPGTYNHMVITDDVTRRNLLDYFESIYGGQLETYPGWVFEVTGPDNSGSYTYCYIPPINVLNQYESFYAGLGGNTQVMTTYWGRTSPGPYIQYKDPLLISYDANYGLITPASNVIFPIAPDHSLQDILKFITFAVGMYGVATAAAGILSGGEALAASAPEVTTEAVTQTALSEAQVAGEEALREYGLAESLGAQITQGEATGWISALQNAGLSVPDSLLTIAQSAPPSSTGTTYQSPPEPDLSVSNAPTPNSSGSTPEATSGSTPEATTSSASTPSGYQAPGAPPSGGSLAPLIKPVASSVLAPILKAIGGGGGGPSNAGPADSYLPGVSIPGQRLNPIGQPVVPYRQATLLEKIFATKEAWWLLALAGVIVIVKRKDRKGHHHE